MGHPDLPTCPVIPRIPAANDEEGTTTTPDHRRYGSKFDGNDVGLSQLNTRCRVAMRDPFKKARVIIKRSACGRRKMSTGLNRRHEAGGDHLCVMMVKALWHSISRSAKR